jgi:hypothetical protein
MANFLVNVALKRGDITMLGILEIEYKTKPTVPNNIYNYHVFNEDENLLKFIHCID